MIRPKARKQKKKRSDIWKDQRALGHIQTFAVFHHLTASLVYFSFNNPGNLFKNQSCLPEMPHSIYTVE